MIKQEVIANTSQAVEDESAIGREEAKQVVQEMMKDKTNNKQSNRRQPANKVIVKDDFPSFAGQKQTPVQAPVLNDAREAFPKFEESKFESAEKIIKVSKKSKN